jgi:hypothetical protein
MITIPTADDVRAKAADLAYGRPLIENSYRGLIAEIIVSNALGPQWNLCSGDWRGWDLAHTTGCRLEVKQSAARQTWTAPKKPATPSFDIRERTGYYEGAMWIPHIGRLAHIYVFAYHTVLDDSADHRDPRQWRFYVIPSARLQVRKTIGLSKVASLSAASSWQELGDLVERTRLAL